jgi:hypothetical protein
MPYSFPTFVLIQNWSKKSSTDDIQRIRAHALIAHGVYYFFKGICESPSSI